MIKSKSNLAIIIIAILTTSSCQYLINRKMAHERKRCIGSFQFDVHASSIGNYISDSSKLHNLILTFMSDSTYEFNMDVDFLKYQTGIWIFEGDGYYYHANMREFDPNTRLGEFVIFEDTLGSMIYPVSKSNCAQVEELIFKRLD
jgi:hypothetical protein